MKFITDYFNAEKFESLFFIGVGIIAVALGIYFWFIIKEPIYKGIAIPFVLVAFIQLTVGTTVYFRSPKDIVTVEKDSHLTIFKQDPKKYISSFKD